jgi:hypothetical protein
MDADVQPASEHLRFRDGRLTGINDAMRRQAESAIPRSCSASFNRRSTCVTRARLTPKWRASAARLSNLPESSSDW